MKKLFLLVMAVLLSVSVQAKTLRDLWLSMPDSLLPTLNKNLRLEFLDLVDMQVKPEVKNLLGEECLMDSVTSDFLEVTTSSSAQIQMGLLHQTSGDSVLCVVRTYSAPEKESEVKFYNQQWQELPSKNFFSSEVWQLGKFIKEKPDTLSEGKYRELISSIEPFMLLAKLSMNDNSMIFKVSLPLVSVEDKTNIEALLVQRKFKWDGRKFNEI